MSIGQDLVRRGATELAPGVYDLRGEMHVDADALCRAAGVDPTNVAQDTVEQLVRDVAQEHDIPLDVQEHGPACRICGCTQEQACDGGCWWVEDPHGRGPLCSACEPAARAEAA